MNAVDVQQITSFSTKETDDAISVLSLRRLCKCSVQMQSSKLFKGLDCAVLSMVVCTTNNL